MSGRDHRVREAIGRGVPPLVVLWLVLLSWACGVSPTAPGEGSACFGQPDSATVKFPDPNLELAVRAELSISPRLGLTCGALAGLTSLGASAAGITSLEGLESLTGLTTLWIRANEITDIGPLRGLTRLTSLNLAANRITDVGPLAGLTNLTFLAINENGGITDISALSGLTKLSGTLWMGGNSITSLAPLAGLKGVTEVNAWDNALTDLDGVSGMANLTRLSVHGNEITDLGGLVGLKGLSILWLHTNPGLSNVQPLLDNPVLGPGASVDLTTTSVDCSDVAALVTTGVAVVSDC